MVSAGVSWCVRVVRHTRILIGQRRRLCRSVAGYSGLGPRAPLSAQLVGSGWSVIVRL